MTTAGDGAAVLATRSRGGRGSAADYLQLASLLGARKTLAKPFSARELLDAVTEVWRA